MKNGTRVLIGIAILICFVIAGMIYLESGRQAAYRERGLHAMAQIDTLRRERQEISHQHAIPELDTLRNEVDTLNMRSTRVEKALYAK